jgi:hypothetical protein
VSTSAGQQVSVDTTSSTTYRKGASPAAASAVTQGAPVLVLGTANGTTIAATQIVAQPASSGSARTHHRR